MSLNNFLPLESLEWDFWNQSQDKIHKNNINEEFNNYIILLMDNLIYVSNEKNILYIC